MKRKFLNFAIVLLISGVNSTFGQPQSRADVDTKYKWDLSVMYASDADWLAHYEKLNAMADEFAGYKGRLGESASTLMKAASLLSDLYKGFYKLSDFASRRGDEDLRISENQNFVEKSRTLGTKISESTAFVDPEILRIPREKIEKFMEEEPGLKIFDFFFDNILRLKEHTFSDEKEKVLASAGMLASGPRTIHSIFENAEKPNPTVTLSTGAEVTLSSSGYVRNRTNPIREDRAKVFEAFFDNYGKFQNTLGAILASKVKTAYFFAKNRGYKTVLESSLNRNNIPVSVYTNLIEQVNKNLPTLHRFLKLKQKMLGYDKLHYYDLYTSTVKKVDMRFTVDEGQKLLLKVLKPMGEDYVETVNKSFADRWVDYYPTPGKRSGAYSSGAAYDEHPYILMNWNNDYNSLSTLAHEMGHTMHSYFSNKNQPFIKSDYPIFVAEIASTCNESILNDYMVKHAKSDEEKLFLLSSYLELMRTTIFRQTSFAEFEWEIHKKVEAGEPLTGEVMTSIYEDIVRRYYGADDGVCVVDPYIRYEWAYIPHFVNYTYYV